MMSAKIADNSYMIIFLALLWAVVILVSKSGGSYAYGRWAGSKLKSKRSAAFATSLLGVLVFIDDGFNCLTVGTVMRPIFDRLKISREKLAYIIDATAAPVCIIAPVSSWAVAVASEVSETGGFHIFLSTIPYNLYALLTIVMVLFLSVTGKDFGPMKQAEETASERVVSDADMEFQESKGRVIDLVLPILVLIVCAILGMAYVGGFFEGVSFSEAIGYNPTAGLSLGAFAGLIAALMSFSMGSSWGTFGMLIPIVTMICSVDNAGVYLIPALGATLAGSVYGDHCSPISDTTILASTGAECEHIRHVETQLPYATLVAVVCAVGYLIAGFMLTPWIAIIVSMVLLVAAVIVLSNSKSHNKK